jgi:uncharacterized iron-regulated membrane protein
MTALQRFRQTSRTLHLSLGLTIGLLSAFTGLTGAGLAFREDIDQALNPGLYRAETPGAPADLDVLAAAARRDHPGAHITRVLYPAHPGETLRMRLSDRSEVFLDPPTGRVQGTRGPDDNVFVKLEDLHRRLANGETGETVVTVGAFALMLLSLSGLVLWSPRRGGARWRTQFRPGAPSLLVNRELHTMVGFYASIVLLMLTWTGISFAYREPVMAFYAALTGSDLRQVAPPKVAPTEAPRAPLARVAASAQAAFPAAAIKSIRLTDRPDRPVEVRLRQPGEVSPLGNSTVFVNPVSAKALSTIDAHTAPLAWRMYYQWNFILHTGLIGGWPTKLLVMAAALMPAFLYVTGWLIWWPKQRAKRQARQKAAERQTADTRDTADVA